MSIKSLITSTAGRGVLHVQKQSPWILTGIGVVGVVATVVMASKATLKLEETVEEFETDRKLIRELHEDEGANEIYKPRDYQRDMTHLYVKHGFKLVKLYGPAVTLGVASIGCIIGGQGIMHKRNVALAAAYKAVEQGFQKYRDRIVEEYGEDADFKARYGEKVNEVTTDEETGHQVATLRFDPTGISIYARFFDESNKNWQRDAAYNSMFVKTQQSYANDLLKARGHVFLNEVYDMLGIERSPEGQIVGWVQGNGDDYIDFGLFNADNEKAREFVNGIERSILLDFNVDGPVFELI